MIMFLPRKQWKSWFPHRKQMNTVRKNDIKEYATGIYILSLFVMESVVPIIHKKTIKKALYKIKAVIYNHIAE